MQQQAAAINPQRLHWELGEEMDSHMQSSSMIHTRVILASDAQAVFSLNISQELKLNSVCSQNVLKLNWSWLKSEVIFGILNIAFAIFTHTHKPNSNQNERARESERAIEVIPHELSTQQCPLLSSAGIIYSLRSNSEHSKSRDNFLIKPHNSLHAVTFCSAQVEKL